MCTYGQTCYQKSKKHREIYSHEEESNEMMKDERKKAAEPAEDSSVSLCVSWYLVTTEIYFWLEITAWQSK